LSTDVVEAVTGVHGGVKFYNGAAKAARAYVERDRSRADDYYLGEGSGVAARLTATLAMAARDYIAAAGARQRGKLSLNTGEVLLGCIRHPCDEERAEYARKSLPPCDHLVVLSGGVAVAGQFSLEAFGRTSYWRHSLWRRVWGVVERRRKQLDGALEVIDVFAAGVTKRGDVPGDARPVDVVLSGLI
jgi:hypothetical protein